MKNLYPVHRWKATWSVFWLLVIMLIVLVIGRLTKLLEITKAHAEELSQKVVQVQQETLKVKEENAELKIPNKEKVFKEVDKLFGTHASEAKKVISCENASTLPEKINLNKNGSADFGPFQINLIHAKRFGTKFMVDPIENVRVAYILFKEQKWNPWYSSKGCHKLG